MKHIRFLLLSIALLAFYVDVESKAAWDPSEKYAKWINSFRIDKAWEFTSNFASQTTNNILDQTSTVDCPTIISWSLMVWNNRTGIKANDDYQMDWAEIYLYRIDNTNMTKKLCKLDFTAITGKNKNNHNNYYDCKLIDDNGCSTRNVNHKYFSNYHDGSVFMYLLTYMSYDVRNFIRDAGSNLGIKLVLKWDGHDYTVSSNALDAVDRTLILAPPAPKISNLAWAVNGNKTCISFDHGVSSTNGLTLKVTDIKNNNTTQSVAFGNPCYYHPTNLSNNKEYLYYYNNERFRYKAYTEKTYSFSYSNYYRNSGVSTSKTISSASVNFCPPVFAQPCDVVLSDNKDGSVRVTWKNRKHTQNEPYDNSDFVVERATNSSFTENYKSYTVPFKYEIGSGDKSSYVLNDTFSVRDEGNKQFYYRIHRVHAYNEELNASANVGVNTNWAKLSFFDADVDTTTNKISIKWEYEEGIKNSNLVLNVTYNSSTITELSSSGKRNRTGIDDVPECVNTVFTAQLYANNIAYASHLDATVARSMTDLGVLDTVIASAGYYNDRVNISWKVNKSHQSFSTFQLYRAEFGDTTWVPLGNVISFDAGKLQYTYDDNTCIPGVYYEYKVIGTSSCNNNNIIAAEEFAVGFAKPYGVVSGQISYSGNQAVQDVAVVAEGVGQFVDRSISLCATDSSNLSVPVRFVAKMLPSTAGTVEFFVRLSNTKDMDPIFQYGNMLRLYNYDDALSFCTYNGQGWDSVKINNVLTSAAFSHIAMTYETVNGQRRVRLYHNGDSLATIIVNAVSSNAFPVRFGYYNGDYLDGNLDEIRFWNVAHTHEQIRRYMNAYLSGSEQGLTGYYRCDDDIVTMLFDISKTGNKYNGRHITMSGVTNDELNTPTVDQLAHKAYTDENGNYLFNNIPYSNNGTLYNIIPMLGIHEFSPSQRPLFFNANANTHNGVDFEDVSSFPVSGKVTFFNTNYPVEGCQFYIDGTTLCTKEGSPVETDAEGKYTIEVPIGQHYITIKKDGHTFVNSGRYPAEGMVEFQNEVQNLTFRDSTFVILTGRVAGGSDEADKPHGFAAGKATIGQARIVIAPSGDLYNLNEDTAQQRVFSVPDTASMHGNCNSVTTTGRASLNLARSITILTDPNTGEFNAMLPPIDFEVKSVELVNNGGNISFDLSGLGNITLGSQDINTKTTDSLAVDSLIYYYFEYSYALDVIHYSVPTMTVAQYTDNNALGEQYYLYKDNVTGFKDTVSLYSIDSVGGITYAFGFPCFYQNEQYTWEISAYETYFNYDYGQVPLVTKQPLRYGIVNVSSNFGEQIENIYSLMDTTITINDSLMYYANGNELMLDSSGTTYYSFVVGEPNVLPPYTSDITINYQDRDRSRYYEWTGNGNTNVIVLGSKVTGSNFVTMGPDEVFYILRDPVGSGSYAEWEAGQTITKKWTKTEAFKRELSVDLYFVLGQDMYVFNGAAVEHVFKTDQKVGPSISASGSSSWVKTKTWKYTNTTTVSTSNASDMVGSKADVFIGYSTNKLFGNAQAVYIKRDSSGNYSIDLMPVLSVQSEFKTQFNYTQHYVEDYLIPNLKVLRNQLIRQVSVSDYDTSYINNTNSVIYITTLSPNDENYGEDNTYLTIWPNNSNLPDSTIMVDEVSGYNNQIRRWIDILKHNERCKVMAHHSTEPFEREKWENVVYGSSDDVFAAVNSPSIDSTYTMLDSLYSPNYDGGWLINNYSLGAGANLSVTETRDFSKVGNGFIEKDGFMAGIKSQFGFQAFAVGSEFFVSGLAGYEKTTENSTENGNSSTVKYHVAISPDEALTFDVYQSPDGYGPIFAARGGQTLCPYQGEEKTKYFEPDSNHVIQSATVPMAEPRITVQNPVATNVPSGKKAIFNVELANLATPNAQTSYLLRQNAATNPNGAILKIDGRVIDESGVLFRLYGSDHINKVVELEQTSPDILDYDSIQLEFSSDCDITDASKVYVSAHFIQTCSEISLKADKSVLNNTTGNAVRFTIDGFDQSFRNLQKVQLQYQREGDDQWHLVKQFRPDSVAIINHNFSFTKPTFPDGTYKFRAVTLCQFGNETVNNESDVVTVVVDMAAPEALGLPYPIDGIYTANNQIYVDFNESIQTGRVLSDNVIVEGVLNAHQVNHSVSLNLENNTAVSNATYNLGSTPFTLEMWLNYSAPGTIFSYAGGGTSGIEFAVDANNRLVATINGSAYTSDYAMLPNRWAYIVIQCDVTTKHLSATYSYDDQNLALFYDQPFTQFASSGNIRFGGNGLNAKIHDVAIWKRIRSTAESLAERSEGKSPYTPDIVSLWRMDEGKGSIAYDDIRQRHLTLQDDAWAYSHVNYAMHVAASDSAMVNISECPIEVGKCYLFEMWFRANGDAELFHLADGSFVTSINGGNLVLNNYTMPISNYQANTWHHLAIINPQISIPIVAVDGVQLVSPSLRTLPAFASSHVILGSASNSNDIDVDEIRLWNINTTLDATRLQSGNCLTGNEDGLLAYYPMEAYVTDPISSQISTEFSLVDKTDADGGRTIVHSNAANAQSLSVPALVESRPLEYVAHTSTTSENRIVVNVTESAHRIEGCWLEIKVKDIVDVNGNYSSPIRWTAYVNRNQLLWDENLYTVVKDEIVDTTITLTIVNNSSSVQSWNINNIPSCMTLSETSGRINPLQTKTITCTIDATADRGETEHTMYLSGNENIACPLYITTKVYANKPNWSINPSLYAHSMNIIAYAEVDSAIVDDAEDMIAAYVDGVLAGVAHPELMPAMGRYYIMLTIYQNDPRKSTTRNITFRYWDASTGMIYSDAKVYQTSNNGTTLTLLNSITYQNDIVYGSVINPLLLEMGNKIEQTIELNRGWNWISFNVEPDSKTFTYILGGHICDFQVIKSHYGSGLPNLLTGKVCGDIGEMECIKGYKINTYTPFNIQLNGFAASLKSQIVFPSDRWTWLGYMPQKAMTVNSAMSNITPTIGDILKSQTQFATWNGYQWVGSLKVMQPGQSYIYRSYNTENITFTYPDYADVPYLMPSMSLAQTNYFNPIDAGYYQGNMTITAKVKYNEEEITSAEIGVFAGTECRGAAICDEGYYFITVAGDSSVQLTFKVLYNDSIYTLQGDFKYQNDAVVGTIASPFVIDLSTGLVPDIPYDPYDPGNQGGDPLSVVSVEAVNGSKVEKVLIDNEVFIIKDGQMYDALGRRRK